MLSLTRHIFAAAILLVIVTTYSIAHAQTQADKKERTGSVSGRVTINGKGAPGIVVSLNKNEVSSQPGVLLRDVTDQDGNYRITGVLAGRYQVGPVAPALIPKDYDNTSFMSWGKVLLIAEGENVDGIDLSLIRGGVITGRVTDANGQPLIEEVVSTDSVESTDRPGSWNRFPRVDQQTDDRGIFRIFGVPPGRYRVSTGLSDDGFSQRTITGRTTYQKTFHPNVTDPAKATIIEIGEGTEATGVDITVGPAVQAFAASGRVLHSETGRPIANATLYLTHIVNTNHHVSTIPRANSQGEFRVANLIPGTYAISTGTDDLRTSSVKFEIVDQDVSGLVIKTSTGASVAGTVIIENPDMKTDKLNLAQLRIMAQVSGDVNEYGFGRVMSIKPDGGFRFAGLPAGTVNFSVRAFSGPDSGYQILRIERDGLVQPNGIQVQNGEQVSGVRVVVVAGNATIRGAVKVENGSLPAAARLHVQITKTGERSSGARFTEVDARGNFMIERLAPGEYELTATASLPSSGSAQVLGSTKQIVNVTEGVIEIILRIELIQNTKP